MQLSVLVEVVQSSLLARRVRVAVRAAEVLDGTVIDRVLVALCNHTVHALLDVLVMLLPSVPVVLDALLRMRSLADLGDTHNTKRVAQWLARRPRFRLHFTPTYSSWLNQVERFFAFLTERCIKRGVHQSTWELERDIRRYLKLHNEDAEPFVWTKSAERILESVGRFCTRLLEVHASTNRDATPGTGH